MISKYLKKSKPIEMCPVCESTNIKITAPYRGVSSIYNRMLIALCNDCEMVFATPMPTDDMLMEYNASYFESAHGGKNENALATAFFTGIARLRQDHIERYSKKYRTGVSSILELGPGLGFFARNWLERHHDTIYYAIETDNSCHSSLKKLGVKIVDSNNQIDKEVDLVVISHVLEHVSSPMEFIKFATSRLRKDGIVFIEVPCRDWEHKPLDEPHLLFFDKKPMVHLLNELGFVDIQVSYHGSEIEKLKSRHLMNNILNSVRNKLITYGIVRPFAKIQLGMEVLTDPIERAAIAPYNAHVETIKPAWWLRAIAKKK